jgi:hypothetical protein
MKSYIKTIISTLFVSCLFFVSCEDGVLDKQPLDQLSTTNFWTTAEDVDLALAGVYNKATAPGAVLTTFVNLIIILIMVLIENQINLFFLMVP